jgi:hypothetical protein
MWWEDAESNARQIAFIALRFSDFTAIKNPLEAAKKMRSDKSHVAGISHEMIIRFDCVREAGVHPIECPAGWVDFEETLVLAEHAQGGNGYDAIHRALFIFDWTKRSVTVLPQDWFNKGSYDFGYQWIAHIARTKAGALIGEGIRLGTFELDASGRSVKRWLSQNPFHRIE